MKNLEIGSLIGYVPSGAVILNNYCFIGDGLKEITTDARENHDGFTGYENTDEIKNIANLLGGNFKEDTNEINRGYPILSWQEEK